MLRRLLMLAAGLTLAATLALAMCNKPLFAPAAKDAHPALWVVRDADTTIYLFGSVHVLRPGLRWFNGPVRKAFDASDQLVLEILEPPRDEMGAIRNELAVYKSGTVWEHLSPPTQAKLHALIANRRVPQKTIEEVEPWYVATAVMQMGLRDTLYLPKFGVEAALTWQAKKDRKPITGLETFREQFTYLDGLSPQAQELLLARTLDNMPNAKARFDAVTEP